MPMMANSGVHIIGAIHSGTHCHEAGLAGLTRVKCRNMWD